MSEFAEDATRGVTLLAPGAIVGRYTLVQKLGEGGMGQIWLADDRDLRRRVALKFLSAHLASDQSFRTRFMREAQSAARLNHPNIVTIYEVGQASEHVFIAMEFIDGIELKDLIDRRQLTADRAIKLFLQVCDGLAVAHTAGVVHRDIKPANIVVDREDRVRILDFGLAKGEGDEQLTQAGTAMGTINYMSPEQCQGNVADWRSDLFSAGIMFFEMLTGLLPFKRGSGPATMQAIITERPPALQQFLPTLPVGFQTMLETALAKQPHMRYQSARQMADEIRRLVGASSAAQAQQQSILTTVVPARTAALAVLQLRNIGSPEDDFLSYGITEDLIVDLTRIGTVRVVPMRSVLKYKNSDAPLEDIAKELRVNLILDGSIMRMGTMIRVSAQLVDVESGENMWASRWEENQDSLPHIKQALAEGVTQALSIGQTMLAAAQVAQPEAVNASAYENYLKGKYTFDTKKDTSDIQKALDLYRNALDREPSLLMARAGVAEVLMHQGELDQARAELLSALAQAERDQQRADQAVILRLLSRLELRQTQLTTAYEYGERSLQIVKETKDYAGEVDSLSLLIQILQQQSRFNEALKLFDKVLQLSRQLDDQQKIAEALKNMGVAYSRVGDLDRALSLYDEAISIAAQQNDLTLQAACESNVGNIHFFRGQYDQAFARYQASFDIYLRVGDPAGCSKQTLNLGLVEASRGNHGEALRLFNEASAGFLKVGDRSSSALTLINISQLLLTQGEDTRAIDAAQQAVDIAEQINHPLARTSGLYHLAEAQVFRGNFELAEKQYQLTLESASQSKLSRYEVYASLGLSQIFYMQGDFKQSKTWSKMALGSARESGDKPGVMRASALDAAITARDGLFFAGVRLLRQLSSDASAVGDPDLRLYLTTLLGEILMQAGELPEERAEGEGLLRASLLEAEQRRLLPAARRISQCLASATPR